MKRVLFPHGDTVGWIICAQCQRQRKESQIATLTRRADGATAVFLPDVANAAVLRDVFSTPGHDVTKQVWVEWTVADLRGSIQGNCRRHGAKLVEVAAVLGAIGTPDAPRKRAI